MTQLSNPNPREEFLSKFDNQDITLEEVLQWQSIVEQYKQGEPKIHKFINKHIQRLTQLITIQGPPHDQLRSLLFPKVACEILSCGLSAMNLQLLTPSNSSLNSQPLCSVLDYFQGTPNSVLSGYVIKVLFSIYEHEPIKTQDYIFRRKYAPEMVKFISSRSVAEFLVSLVVIQDDRILTYYLNQRNQFLNYIADTYVKGEFQQDQMMNLGWTLCQIISKLWSTKCLQAGQFSKTIFRISQLILDNTNDLIRHNPDLLPLVIEKFVEQGCDAPFILKQCASRIITFLSNFQPQIWTSQSGKQIYKFSKQNLKLLIALSSIITKNYHIVASLLNRIGCFGLLLNITQRYQNNNMVHIEVQKIFKHVIKSQNPLSYAGIIQTGNFVQRVNQMVFCVEQPNKSSKKAYMGSIINILKTLREAINTSKLFGQLKSSNKQFVNILYQYIDDKSSKTQTNLAGCKLKTDYSIPSYDQSILQQQFKAFFQAPKIEKDPRQMQNKYILNQIFNECAINKKWGQAAPQIQTY